MDLPLGCRHAAILQIIREWSTRHPLNRPRESPAARVAQLRLPRGTSRRLPLRSEYGAGTSPGRGAVNPAGRRGPAAPPSFPGKSARPLRGRGSGRGAAGFPPSAAVESGARYRPPNPRRPGWLSCACLGVRPGASRSEASTAPGRPPVAAPSIGQAAEGPQHRPLSQGRASGRFGGGDRTAARQAGSLPSAAVERVLVTAPEAAGPVAGLLLLLFS